MNQNERGAYKEKNCSQNFGNGSVKGTANSTEWMTTVDVARSRTKAVG